MYSLYYFLKNDEDSLARISSSIIKKLYIPYSWSDDVRQEMLLSWLEQTYDPQRTRGEILAFAYRRAIMSISEWRRRTILPVLTTRAERPEPISICIDSLVGEDLERFIAILIEKWLEQERLMEQMLEYEANPELEPQPPEIKMPQDPKGNRKYEIILEMAMAGEALDKIAHSLNVSKRTIHRRLNDIKNENRR